VPVTEFHLEWPRIWPKLRRAVGAQLIQVSRNPGGIIFFIGKVVVWQISSVPQMAKYFFPVKGDSLPIMTRTGKHFQRSPKLGRMPLSLRCSSPKTEGSIRAALFA
jgi:hypothetical protein